MHTVTNAVSSDGTFTAQKRYRHVSLTDLAVRSAKPKVAAYKVADSRGLYLLVVPAGGKLWRFDYRFAGKRKTLALGKYPRKTLAAARSARDNAKEQLGKNIDPSLQRKLAMLAINRAAGDTFEAIAEEWLQKIEREGRADATLTKSRWFVALLSPALGQRPIATISPLELLLALRKIEARGKYESARRARSTSGRIFRYAIATGRADRNPAADLAGALISPKVTHHAAITEPAAIGGLLRAIDAYSGSPIVRAALRLLPLVFVRPVELRHARWTDVDITHARWTIPASVMKMRTPHIVPLSRQAVALVEALRALTSDGPYLFPSIRTLQRPISENTLNGALRRLGYSGDEMTSHGFRSMASTRLNEMGRWNPDAIERQLAHRERNAARAAYNHAQHLKERTEMMQVWADYLDEQRSARTV